ncbi:MAG: hypothetical protein UY07_C0014G0013 [Parcubacteria group bacterium GW2011_GWA1_47_8]|uniref:Secreted protein n=1 Tax=Candidatus Gottesmanbacteria bacterium GW2011_GWA2_42_18 TaxID=1618442 RepID=A0A0G1C9D5_9BACT|nr:MAG: hypothetical protein UV09_C0020G0010 [Candidatus Gottesmanbacteria bacterium GW2011_GWA2_42_18]KKU81593.1 MAG: hypothetical protein UY07_C0014G0013 [Parcubacteria group bacterium GW2011_GWA1_47_8]
MKICAKIVALLFWLISADVVQATMPNTDGSTIDCSPATDTQFVPSWGQVYVDKDPYSKYIYQWMYWDNYTRVAWFTANGDSTYEPEALFDGSGSGYPEPAHETNVSPAGQGNSSTAYGYFLRNVSYNHGDQAGYWASDLPSPYQDTAWGDTSNEWDVTVGSAQAVLIEHQKVYFTVTRMYDGGANSGGVKLSSQRGRLANPTTPWYVNYWGKWNSYGCAQPPTNASTTFTLPWGNFNAPGCRKYWYKWDISVNEAC